MAFKIQRPIHFIIGALLATLVITDALNSYWFGYDAEMHSPHWQPIYTFVGLFIGSLVLSLINYVWLKTIVFEIGKRFLLRGLIISIPVVLLFPYFWVPLIVRYPMHLSYSSDLAYRFGILFGLAITIVRLSFREKRKPRCEDHPFFGSDKDTRPIEEVMHELRRGRYSDL